MSATSIAPSRLKWGTVERDDNSRGFAPWVRELHGHSGVYLIRDAASSDVRYVGESHTGKLYETLTRHFQRWGGKGSGPTYPRGAVEVAIVVMPAEAVLDEQWRYIEELEPRDNDQDGRSYFKPVRDGDVPF